MEHGTHINEKSYRLNVVNTSWFIRKFQSDLYTIDWKQPHGKWLKKEEMKKTTNDENVNFVSRWLIKMNKKEHITE